MLSIFLFILIRITEFNFCYKIKTNVLKKLNKSCAKFFTYLCHLYCIYLKVKNVFSFACKDCTIFEMSFKSCLQKALFSVASFKTPFTSQKHWRCKMIYSKWYAECKKSNSSYANSLFITSSFFNNLWLENE